MVIKIEKANILELDWAMANMDSKATKKKEKKNRDELAFEADMKASKEDVCRFSLLSSGIYQSVLFYRATFVASVHSYSTIMRVRNPPLPSMLFVALTLDCRAITLSAG